MRVKGILFVGVMGAILTSAGIAADTALPQIASTKYVEKKLSDKVGDLTSVAQNLGIENPENATIAETIKQASNMDNYATKDYADEAALTAAAVVSEEVAAVNAKVGDNTVLKGTNNENGEVVTAIVNLTATVDDNTDVILENMDAIDANAADISELEAKVQTNTNNISTLSGTVGTGTLVTENKTLITAINEIATKQPDTSGLEAQLAGKVDKAQGSDKAGQYMVVGADGNVTPAVLSVERANLAADIVTSLGLADTAVQNADLGALATKDTVSSGDIDNDAIITAKILDKNVTKEKLADDVQASLDKADGLESRVATNETNITNLTSRVATAESDAGTAKTNAQNALDAANGLTSRVAKNETDIAGLNTQFNAVIPKPTGACAAQSGRCVLSVTNVEGPDGVVASALTWLDVTTDTVTEP